MKIWLNGCFDVLHHGQQQQISRVGLGLQRTVVREAGGQSQSSPAFQTERSRERRCALRSSHARRIRHERKGFLLSSSSRQHVDGI